MIVAALPILSTILFVIGFVGVLGGVGWIIIQGLRLFTRSAEASRLRTFEGLRIRNRPGPGLVSVVFHTYCGIFLFVEQAENRFWAPPDDAREALRRLHRYNLCWGMFAYGLLVLPLLSYGNYLAQKRSIRIQEMDE